MSYFNYHSNVKKKINQSTTVQMILVNSYNNISPCLVIVIDSGNYPIREHRWQEYFELASKINIKIKDKRNNE